jgi:hypothetical protein
VIGIWIGDSRPNLLGFILLTGMAIACAVHSLTRFPAIGEALVWMALAVVLLIAAGYMWKGYRKRKDADAHMRLLLDQEGVRILDRAGVTCEWRFSQIVSLELAQVRRGDAEIELRILRPHRKLDLIERLQIEPGSHDGLPIDEAIALARRWIASRRSIDYEQSECEQREHFADDEQDKLNANDAVEQITDGNTDREDGGRDDEEQQCDDQRPRDGGMSG